MKKQIVIISENTLTDYTDFANMLLTDTDYEAIHVSEADINSYEAVVYIFSNCPHNESKMLNSWVGHNHLRAVWGNSEREKLHLLKKELMHIAGIPAPLEIERKFLIEYPDILLFETIPNCTKVSIEQIYLSPIDGAHIRIRKRSVHNNDIYIKTEKKKISDTVRIETECEITKDEYNRLLQYADPALSPVKKSRYCLMDKGRYFEIDVFPFWSDKAYLEIELTDENEVFHLPECIKVIKEVTEDKSYTNRSLAKYIKEHRTDEL